MIFIFWVGQTELSVSLIPRTVILVFPCQSVQTYFNFHLPSQAKQNTQLLSMQLIIFNALSGSDLLSGPLVGNPYSKRESLKINEMPICLSVAFSYHNGKEIMLWVMKKSRYKYLSLSFYSPLLDTFLLYFPSKMFPGALEGIVISFFFYPTKIDKAVGDFSRS